MSAKEKNILFRLVGVSTEEFATYKEHYVPNRDKYKIGLNVEIKANEKEHLIGMFTRFTFEQESNSVLMLESACHFQLEPTFWEASIKENSLLLPKGFATHLLVLSVGTARGIIHAKKPNWLGHLVLPTMDVSGVFKEDVSLAVDNMP